MNISEYICTHTICMYIYTCICRCICISILYIYIKFYVCIAIVFLHQRALLPAFLPSRPDRGGQTHCQPMSSVPDPMLGSCMSYPPAGFSDEFWCATKLRNGNVTLNFSHKLMYKVLLHSTAIRRPQADSARIFVQACLPHPTECTDDARQCYTKKLTT